MNCKKVFFVWACWFGSAALAASTAPTNALHLDWMNTSISPKDDFYTYANGTWQTQNPIPPDYSTWGSFNVLNEKVQEIVHELVLKASEHTRALPGSIEQKVGDFYFSGMDEQQINELGVKPLESEFRRIEAIKSLFDLQRLLPHLHALGVDSFFEFGSMQDFKDSRRVIGVAMQGGLGLPDRDYYLKDDAKFRQIRQAYLEHAAKMFELLGDDSEQARAEAKTVLGLETQLAKVSLSQVAQRDPYAIYHLVDVGQLSKTMPNIAWSAYLSGRGQAKLKKLNLAMPDFFKALNEQLQQTPIAEWKTYLRWRLIDTYAPYLSQPFVDQNFKMLSVLSGVEKILPRWKRVLATENAALGFAIGKLYVDQYFSAKAKQEALELLTNLRAVLKQDISTLSWMMPATREAALHKLDKMELRVGYPSTWRDYSSLQIDRGPYVLNVLRANEYLTRRDLNKIGKPVDRTEWAMTPQTINAYYDPSMNSINLPAGILQPPFFDPDAPMALNYGSIGFVMGHELTHGFDDQGAKFDGYGNLKQWWTPSDEVKFKAATQCISDQFSKYRVNGDMRVQGPLVVGEAVADLGGIRLAYKAFHQSKEFQRAKTIEGLTPDQQFFLGAAHVWALNIRAEQLRNQVTTDPHPPARYRVNGSLANLPEFQAAFSIPDLSPMVNKTRCSVW